MKKMSAEKEGKNMMNNFEAGARISPAGSHIKHNKEEEERKKSIFFLPPLMVEKRG